MKQTAPADSKVSAELWLGMLVPFATYALPRHQAKDAKGLGRTVAEHVGAALFTLALGWIGTWFI